MSGTLVAPYGRQFIFEVYVAKASDGQIAASGDWTIASGDFKVSKDQGSEANLGTLPSFTASSDKVKITLSASEMTGKDIIVKMKDDATVLGDYWRIQTADHPSAAIPNGVIAEGVAQSGGTDKIRLAVAADSPATADLFNGNVIYIYEGTGVGQSRIIVDYSTDRDAFVYVSGGTAEGAQWAVTPDNTSRYRVYAQGFVPASMAISGGYVQADLTASALADIATEISDALTVDTYAEPSAPPAATASLKDKIGWLALKARNKITQTATTQVVYADDGSTAVGTSTVSDNGTTATRGEYA